MLWRDAQCGDPVVPESKLVTMRNRTAGKRAADLRGGNRQTVVLLEADNLGMQRMEAGIGTINPRPDRLASVFMGIVGNNGFRGEKIQKIARLAGVVGLEEAGDRSG